MRSRVLAWCDVEPPAWQGQRRATTPRIEARSGPARARKAGHEEARKADSGPGLDGVSLVSCSVSVFCFLFICLFPFLLYFI